MLEKTPQKLVITKPQDQLTSLEPSLLRSARNGLLSTFVPVGFAVTAAKYLSTPTAERGVFKAFVQELQDGLVVKVGSSQLVGQLITLYLNKTLQRKMHTGELLEFADQLEFDLTQAYDLRLNEKTRQLYKQRAFQGIMSKLGPHGLKFIQTMRPKDSSSWIAKIITSAQSDLPSPTIAEIEAMVKDAFEKQGSMDYVRRFPELCEIIRVYGAGTIGIAVLMRFKSPHSPQDAPKERVIKIVRPGSLQNFLIDQECFTNAVETLLAEHRITEQEARSLIDFNQIMVESELRELNLNIEMAHLVTDPYHLDGVCETIKCDWELSGKARDVVFMDVAPGIPLGKYLQTLSQSLANASTDEEKKPLIQKFAALRSRYAKLALLHYGRAHRNQSLHTDLHPGNLFYDDKQDKWMVLDLGSMAHPFPEAEHLKLNRFLLAVNLSLGTGDSHYLRLYYQNEAQENSKPSLEQMEPMLATMQSKLDQIRNESGTQNVIDVDAADEVMGIIKDAILAQGVHIVPSALFHIAKANAPVSDALDSMKQVLVGASSLSAIPYSERTQFGIALNASWQARKANKNAWTDETWHYFSQSLLHPKAGYAQLQFEKKFIYGIFGLDEKESTMADVVIPATALSAPLVVYLGARALKKAVATLAVKIPEIIESYQVMEKMRTMYQAGRMGTDEGFRHMKEFFERSKQRYNEMSFRYKAPSAQNAEPPRPFKAATLVKPAHLRNRFFVGGVVVGGLLVEAAHRWCPTDESKKLTK